MNPETRSTVWACGQGRTERDGSRLHQWLETTQFNKYGNNNHICSWNATKVKQMMELEHLVDKTDGTFSYFFFFFKCAKELHKTHHLPNAWLLFLETELKCSHHLITNNNIRLWKRRSTTRNTDFSEEKTWKLKCETKLFSYSKGKCVHVFVFIICTITYTNASKVTQETSIK